MKKRIEDFLDYLRHERNASVHTIAAYGRDLGQLAAFLKERKTDWRSADNVILRGFLGTLYERKNKKSTIGRKLAAMRSFYDFAIKKKWIVDNPARILATPRQEKNVPSFLSEDEMTQFLDVPTSDKPLGRRDRAILELLYASGIRVSELVGNRHRRCELRGTHDSHPGQGQEGETGPVRDQGRRKSGCLAP